ncbi:hypothetical protein [Protaetiibacter larvae]|uniref:Uncharacterized protein n=1 Tax=Protaetiibacter larvae TaxID=2592654 RepID=A0A5C1Y7J5_9MICO|nr:hypothetical protein [Protaetiibacter larvae]QEO08882.1 hypothetical protein FLP23_01905 [Protaetiibacter larvae]
MPEYAVTLDPRVRLVLAVSEGTPAAGWPITAALYLERLSGTGRWSNYTDNSWSITVDGQELEGSGTYDLRGTVPPGTTKRDLLISHVFTVAAAATTAVSGSFSDPRGNVAAGTVAATFALSPRNRARVGVGDAWVEAEVYAGVNGIWKPAVPYAGVDDAWKPVVV